MNPNVKQWTTGKNADGSFNSDADKWRRVLLVILGTAMCVGWLLGAPSMLQLFLSGLAVGVALKCVVARW